ncbi:hypothetical protein [Streptomyces sp. NPDC050164]|uniref:hypothetical protein n=1 Tax=Streptomyces sp. NPDC050164 TaxID=3365605 RepID=UPI0037B9F4BB
MANVPESKRPPSGAGKADRVEADRVEADRVEADRVEADRVEADRVECRLRVRGGRSRPCGGAAHRHGPAPVMGLVVL